MRFNFAIDWQEIVNPSGNPADLPQKYLDDAVKGNGPQGAYLWQIIQYQTFDNVRDIYLNLTTESNTTYAVGAMTRGQIINVGMARGIAQATTKIADDLVKYLTRNKEHDETK